MTADHTPERQDDLTTERLAANLRAAIKASGLTQQEVAERASMDPTALSKALAGARSVTSLELALICAATGADVLAILGAHPLHGPSLRQGIAQGWLDAKRAFEHGDWQAAAAGEVPEDVTACGMAHPEHPGVYCDVDPPEHWGPHHADLWWEQPDPRGYTWCYRCRRRHAPGEDCPNRPADAEGSSR